MSSAAGARATITEHPGLLRVAVPAPTGAATWEALMAVVRAHADSYGSSDSTGTPVIWAAVHTEEML
jgi:hypothetical protein